MSVKLHGGIVRDYYAIIIGLLKVNGDNRQISEVLTIYMVTTRSMAEAAKEAAENSVLQNQDQEENLWVWAPDDLQRSSPAGVAQALHHRLSTCATLGPDPRRL